MPLSSGLKMAAVSSSETLVPTYKSIRLCYTEDQHRDLRVKRLRISLLSRQLSLRRMQIKLLTPNNPGKLFPRLNELRKSLKICYEDNLERRETDFNFSEKSVNAVSKDIQ
jgi:hypothetical protein